MRLDYSPRPDVIPVISIDIHHSDWILPLLRFAQAMEASDQLANDPPMERFATWLVGELRQKDLERYRQEMWSRIAATHDSVPVERLEAALAVLNGAE
jgi:hypothetical protein